MNPEKNQQDLSGEKKEEIHKSHIIPTKQKLGAPVGFQDISDVKGDMHNFDTSFHTELNAEDRLSYEEIEEKKKQQK